jgi:hypothetical protein
MTNSALTEILFWQQIFDDQKRTIICTPDLESRVKGCIDARGLFGIFEVLASPNMPEDQIMIVDKQAIKAAMSKPIRLNFIN